MIKLEHVVLASPEQMEFIIEGMRNPMNSWDKSDSVIGCYMCGHDEDPYSCDCCSVPQYEGCNSNPEYFLGQNDHSLMQRLANAGTDHRKFMRMMPVYVRITAPLYWWKEFDTYKVGTIANSCSTMHKIAANEFTLEDFSCEHLYQETYDLLRLTVDHLNKVRDIYLHGGVLRVGEAPAWFEPKDKEIWWQMIQLLPSSYNQTRNVMINYEVLANIYKSRKDHKLDEWREFCQWIESLPFHELIDETNSSDKV